MSQSDFDSLVPTRDLDRRSVVKTAVGSGFAAAVLPVSAQTLKTDGDGLTLAEVVDKVPDPQAMDDLDTTVAWAAANGGDTGRPGGTGFCWGGRQTWLFTEHSPVSKAAVAWYGPLTGAPSALEPGHPVDGVAKISTPVLGLCGGEDQGLPLTGVEQMRTALAGGSVAAKRSQIVVYPGAPHAFNADSRPSYHKAAADDGWKRCLDWFRADGVV